MAVQIQILRGTTAENDSFTGAIGVLTYDTEAKQLRIHDGTTQGGIPLPTEAQADYIVDFQEPTPDNNYTWYRKYKSGWVEQGGKVTSITTGSVRTQALPVTMSNEHYTVNMTLIGTGTSDTGFKIVAASTTASEFGYIINSSDQNTGFYWTVMGMYA